MHPVPPSDAYFVERSDGVRYGPYATLTQLAGVLDSAVVARLGARFTVTVWVRDSAGALVRRTYPVAEFIVRDSVNRVIDPDVVASLWHELRARRRAAKPTPAFRAGPVPGTGRKRHRLRACGVFFRRPRTYAERRAAVESRDEGMPFRGKRRNVPSAWDDIVRSDRADRSWKRHRRTRWRAKS